jgi:hypothetical protein
MEPRDLRVAAASLPFKKSLLAVSHALLACSLLSVSAFAVDASFQLVKEGEKVNVYGRGKHGCADGGAEVLFVVENKTKERLELKMELLSLKIRNKLTVVVEPSSNTSVLSMPSEKPLCGVELVDMKVNSLSSPGEGKEVVPVPVTAATEPEAKI